MGSCSSEQHNPKGLDGTFGRLVWVRRGNGSWWPGQIVDAGKMSNSCLDAQKSSGVPIKLLGRDDVNVDWYNLEKTKKVKAFRCGDYDSCIEKAKALVDNPSKKRGRQLPRENAIILALELESAFMSKDCDNNCSGADNSDSDPGGSCPKASLSLSMLNTSSPKENSDSALELSHSGISFEEANATAALPDEHPNTAKTSKTPNDSEDDGNEGLKKRMKGLDDLGVGSNVNLVTESAPQCLSSLLDLCALNRPPTRHLANGSKGDLMPSFKKKRSKMVFRDIIKRKNRRRMLTKVFQSDTLVTVPIIFDELWKAPSRSSYMLEPDVLNNASEDPLDVGLKDSDPPSMSKLLVYDSLENLFDVPLINEVELSDDHQGFPDISCSSLKPPVDHLDALLHEDCLVEVGANEEQEEPASASSPTGQLSCLAHMIEKGPSEWQSKGKRKSRHHQNRNPEPDTKQDESKADVADPDNQPFACRLPRFSALSRYEIPDPSVRCAYPDSVLYDVHVEVKTGYRPQHVPYISLMSKLNGKPITGHPVAVEVLEDGECDFIVDLPGFYTTSGSCELDDDKQTKTRKHPSKKTKKHGSSTKKTRTLSSLTGSVGKERKVVVERLNAGALACIPLKVVFSRINEALNGSTRAIMRGGAGV